MRNNEVCGFNLPSVEVQKNRTAAHCSFYEVVSF